MDELIEVLVSVFYRDFEAENHPYLMEIFKILFLSIIIILMIAGRLGVFAFGLILVGKAKTKHFKYPVGKIII